MFDKRIRYYKGIADSHIQYPAGLLLDKTQILLFNTDQSTSEHISRFIMYYSEKLSAQRLQNCYDIAPPRIQQYLYAEIEFVCSRIGQNETVLELGCGYGRLIPKLVEAGSYVVGIDNAIESLTFAKSYLEDISSYSLVAMDASSLGFSDNQFDIVVCLQNGISALHVEPTLLIAEAFRVLKPNSKSVFTSYSPKIWDERLRWFELQAEEGLLGKIDYVNTGDGVIVCEDGFHATTMSAEGFNQLGEQMGLMTKVIEIDDSCIVCEMTNGG